MPAFETKGVAIKSLVKTLRLLKRFSPQHTVWTAEDLASSLKYHKSSVQRILATLEKEGFLARVAPRRCEYRLGPEVLFLGNVADLSLDLRSVARPTMAGLVKKVQETCYLCVADRHQCLYIEKMECSHPIRIINQVGQRNPMHCTGVGKALMSGMTAEEVDRLIAARGLNAHTRHTITEPRRLKRELAAVRSRGIALDNEELDLGVKCVAAPIRDRTGAVVAAISLSGPAQRFTPAAIRRFEKEIKQAAMEISRMLGLVPPAPSGKPLAEKEDRENAFLAAGRPRPPIRQYALDR
ncbi:MAG: IclR family transcriptional regulator [Desulfobacterales bacterium]|jgi:DNA-binding IclR family transcriptional regulator|nr:IclR family transcriptional regulator [Desulfobacterales bacterium]